MAGRRVRLAGAVGPSSAHPAAAVAEPGPGDRAADRGRRRATGAPAGTAAHLLHRPRGDVRRPPVPGDHRRRPVAPALEHGGGARPGRRGAPLRPAGHQRGPDPRLLLRRTRGGEHPDAGGPRDRGGRLVLHRRRRRRHTGGRRAGPGDHPVHLGLPRRAQGPAGGRCLAAAARPVRRADATAARAPAGAQQRGRRQVTVAGQPGLPATRAGAAAPARARRAASAPAAHGAAAATGRGGAPGADAPAGEGDPQRGPPGAGRRDRGVGGRRIRQDGPGDPVVPRPVGRVLVPRRGAVDDAGARHPPARPGRQAERAHRPAHRRAPDARRPAGGRLPARRGPRRVRQAGPAGARRRLARRARPTVPGRRPAVPAARDHAGRPALPRLRHRGEGSA